MLQYIYKSEHAGMRQWPSGELRLEGIEATEDPNAADIFVCPGNIRIFEAGSGVLNLPKLRRLPYFIGNESRHVFFDCSDNFKAPINLPIIFIRCDVRTWMMPHDPNTIQMAWPVENYAECIEVPDGGFKYDVSFHAWLSSDARIQSSNACKQESRLKCDIAEYSDFTGYIYDQPEGIRRRAEFRRSMRESRVALCPESIPGVLPYRFFEAMSAGRVPLLVGSNYVLPFADEIDYDSCILTTTHPEKAADIIQSFVASYSDDRIAEMGKLGRKYWAQFLDSRKWAQMMAYAVSKKIGALCPTAA